MQKRLGIAMQQGFGMTETSPVTHLNRDPAVSRGSIGLPVPNTQHKLVDIDDGTEVPLPKPGETDSGRSAVGELWVRGPQIMLGYLNNQEQTDEVLVGDGWLRTGDLAEQDEHGNVFIVDRLKEVIKYKGYQVPPAELEAVLLTHPEVADSAVVGVVRQDGLEIPKGFVVMQPNHKATETDIMQYVAERVAPYKKIREIEFVEVVPKSSTGKILRRELKAEDAAQQG